MKTYIYTDHIIEKVIFVCDAENIMEADKLYTEVIGKNPTKQPYVGVKIEKQKGN